MKRILSLVLVLALALGLCVPVSAADFADIPANHTFYDAISWCASQGIVGGYSDSTFKPANTVTRANFVVMLTRAFYAGEIDSSYVDVNEGSFAANYLVAKRHRMLESTNFDYTILRPQIMNVGINRYNMAQLMNNIMTENGFSASLAEREAAAAKISDFSSIPGQYIDAVTNVYALGIIGGYSDGTFGGNITMNRGQAAVVIYRLAQYVGDGSGIVAAVHVGDDPANVPTSPDKPAAQNPSTSAENGALVLRDGSAVTEANALKIIEQVKQVYPSGTAWDGSTYRNNDVTIGGRKLGGPSTAITTVSNVYFTSMTGGCGGFAGVVSDAIFGGYDNGGQNFPVRKLSSLADIRPGDIISKVDGNGKNLHFLTAASSVTNIRTVSTGVGDIIAYDLATYDGNNNDKVSYATNRSIYAQTYQNVRYEAWTRWPD